MSMNLALYHGQKPKSLQVIDILLQTPTDLSYRLIKLNKDNLLEEYLRYAEARIVGDSKENIEKEPHNPKYVEDYKYSQESFAEHKESIQYYIDDGYEFTLI